MSRAANLWLRVGVATTASLALLLLLAPPHPSPRLPLSVAAGAGLGCGVVLYMAVTRCRPRLPARRGSAAVGLGKQAFLGLLATNEEIVWRRVVLGELLGAGAVAAVVVSTVGFALVHRSRRRLQLGTGAVFGVLYVATGALAACVAAHWAYNALVGARVDRRRAVGTAAL
jgi:membrane protease YdiL (CAAX protease family)